jgi:hypothetical protein
MPDIRSKAKKDVEEFLRGTRSLIQKEVFEVSSARNLSDVFEQEAQNIETLRQELQDRLEDLSKAAYGGEFGEPLNVEDLDAIGEAVYQRAFMDTVETIKDKAITFLVNEAIKAVVATQEYNYDLYVDHLLGALEANKDTLIAIIPRPDLGAVEVKVSLESLGKAEEWGAAIKGYREQKKLGSISSRDKERASKMWAEKYYGSAREGVKVIRGKPRSTTLIGARTRRGKSNLLYQKDVTQRYKGKYRETIQGRLSFLPSNKAPFWTLIEHGNVEPHKDTDLGIDADGIPYPTFGPTNFRRNTEEAVATAFSQLYNEYLQAAVEIVRGITRGAYDYREDRIRQSERDRRREREAKEREIRQAYKRHYGPAFELQESIDPSAIKSPKMQAFIETERGRYEAYVQGNTVRISLRDPRTGRFVKLPTNWRAYFE